MAELGYDYVDQVISSSLECPICRSPFVDPVMPRSCQHLFCRTCLHRALDLSPTCPIDRTRIRNRTQELVEAPRVVNNLLDELKVRCNGCRKELKREEWGRHCEHCQESRAASTVNLKAGQRYSEAVEKREGDEYEQVEDIEIARCEACEETVPSGELESHSQNCSGVPRPCRYCSLPLLPSAHSSHLLDSCPLVPTPCPHASFGCPYVGLRSSLSSDHLYSDCPYEPLKDCFERFKHKEREWESENWELRQKVQGLEARLEDVEGYLADTKYSLGEYFVHPSTSKHLETDRNPLPPAPLPATLSSLSSRNASLSSSLSAITQSHTDSLHATQHLVEELNSMRSVIGGMRMQMGELMRTVQVLSSTSGRSGGQMSGSAYASESTRAARRPVLGSRRSDSSSEDQDQEFYHDSERYLSSSASDPEEDLPLFSSTPSLAQNRSQFFPRSAQLPMESNPFVHPAANRVPWSDGVAYGLGVGGAERRHWGDGSPALFSFGPTRLSPRAMYPGMVPRAGSSGRVVGGIGGGMKL